MNTRRTVGIDALRATIARVEIRASIPYVVLGLLIAVAASVAGAELDRSLRAVEGWMTGLHPWNVAVFIGLFVVLTSLLIPDTVLAIMAGTVFGLWWGFAAVGIGAVLAAGLQFALSRRLLQRRIRRALDARPSLAAIQRAAAGPRLHLQVLLRLTPANPATLSYLLGAAGVRFRGFLLAFLVSMPSLFVEVYFGYAARHVARMAGPSSGTGLLHDVLVLGGVAVAIVAMVLVARTALRAVQDAVITEEAAP